MKFSHSVTGAAALFMAAGCASSPQIMSADSRVPAAQGQVKAKAEGNGNTRIDVKVKHMAKPNAVEPMAQTYVVWAQDNNNTGNVQNLGALHVDDDLEGEIEAITPLKRFDVFITAEPVATAQYPTGTKTLWTTVEAN
jgi:hypothetical protein